MDRLFAHEVPHASKFPHDIDTFYQVQDAPPSAEADMLRLKELRQLPATGAHLAEVNELTERLTPYLSNASDMNTIYAGMTNIQTAFNDNFNLIFGQFQHQFSVQGDWNATTQYLVNNIVKFVATSDQGGRDNRFDGELFIVTRDDVVANWHLNTIPIGTSPVKLENGNWVVNKPYWKQLSSRGEKGAPGVAAQNWKGNWHTGTYHSGDMVRRYGLYFVANRTTTVPPEHITNGVRGEVPHWETVWQFVTVPREHVEQPGFDRLLTDDQIIWVRENDSSDNPANASPMKVIKGELKDINLRTISTRVESTTPGKNIQEVVDDNKVEAESNLNNVKKELDSSIASTNRTIGSLTNLHSQIKDRSSIVNSINSVFDEHSSTTGHLDTATNNLRRDLGIPINLNNSFVDAARNNLVSAINQVTTRFAPIENSIGVERNRITALNSLVTSSNSTFTSQINTLNSKVNTLENAGLPSHAARRDQANTFTGTQTFSGLLRADNNLAIRNGTTQVGIIRAVSGGFRINGGTSSTNGLQINTGGTISAHNNLRFMNASGAAKSITFYMSNSTTSGQSGTRMVWQEMRTDGTFRLASRWNANSTQAIMTVDPGTAIARFNTGAHINNLALNANGNVRIHHGTGVPANSLGRNGDIYFRRAST